MSSLVVENLTIDFGGVRAVDNVSFEVEPGETFAIIGPNGAGKSTIFNLISRIYEPTSGSIHYGKRDLLDVAAHRVIDLGIARTFQNIDLFEQATVLQNLLVGRHSRMSRNLFRDFLFVAGARAREREHRRKVEDIIIIVTNAYQICPTAQGRTSNWRGHSVQNPRSCYLTNLRQVSTRKKQTT
jgi:branched-chain amino acid transport system ATP-binding protein